MFGTYVERGQLLLFPFAAYSRDHDREYNLAKLGFGLATTDRIHSGVATLRMFLK